MISEKSPSEIIRENQKAWDIVADLFTNASALPVWGPFGIGDDLNLIPEIAGKTFLEIACGSGRSLKYLTEQGAAKVYGLDISSKQLEEATLYNKKEIDEGKVELFQGPMEARINIEPVDCIFSIYGIGWTPTPEITLGNVFSYLKPGGVFIWSWDHTIFTDVIYEEGNYIVNHSYHDETPLALKNWKKDTTIYLTYRKTSTWFQLLRSAGFDIIGYFEPVPKNLSRGHSEPEKYYSIQKAKKIPCSFIFVCKKAEF